MTSPADLTPPRGTHFRRPPPSEAQVLLACHVLLERWMLATAENADPGQGDPTVARVIIETLALRDAIAGMVPVQSTPRAYLALGDLVERAERAR